MSDVKLKFSKEDLQEFREIIEKKIIFKGRLTRVQRDY